MSRNCIPQIPFCFPLFNFFCQQSFWYWPKSLKVRSVVINKPCTKHDDELMITISRPILCRISWAPLSSKKSKVGLQYLHRRLFEFISVQCKDDTASTSKGCPLDHPQDKDVCICCASWNCLLISTILEVFHRHLRRRVHACKNIIKLN